MNFHLKSKPKNKFNYKLFLFVFLIFVIFMSIFFRDFFRNTIHITMEPVFYLKNTGLDSMNYFSRFFIFKNSLIKENQELKNELDSLRLVKMDYDILLRENEEIKADLGRIFTERKIISSILSKPPQIPFDTLLLDAGSESGVSLGDKVYISDSVIIATITEVTPKTSIATLFSNGSQETEVISSRTGSNFVIKGDGGLNFKVEVPRDTDIIWGDTFLYPNLRSSVVATVYFVDSNLQSSFKTIHLKVPTNVFQLKRVFIVK